MDERVPNVFNRSMATERPIQQDFLTRCRLEILLFLLVFITFSYFYNGAAWNHISRINTIFSFVEPNTPDYLSFRINRFIIDPIGGKNTGDWAKFEGNYYSNKAPGVALIGIPFYYLVYQLQKWIGWDPTSDFFSLLNVYFLHLIITVLPISIAAVFFYKIIHNYCKTGRLRGFFLTVILFWGTLMFPYGSQIWGHVTATAFLIISLYFVLMNSRSGFMYSGFFIGLAVLTEYSCAISLGIFTVYLLVKRKPKELITLVLGGTIPCVAFMGYHKICFGSVFAIANFYNNPYFLDENAVGKMFGTLNMDALWGLTFSRYRGLFVHMPILLLFFPALYFSCKQKLSSITWICLANIFFFFLMNLSFNGWHGGACVGPRYLIPSLPFYVLLFLRLPDATWVKLSYIMLFIPTFVNMFLSTAITPLIPQNVMAPLLGYYRSFLVLIVNGENLLQPYTLPIRFQSSNSPVVQKYSAFNLGNLVGLSDCWSLLPWFLVFGIIFWQICVTINSNG